MGKAIDTLERRRAIKESAELAAIKHLARAYGVAVQRRPRPGPVVFNVGVAGKDHITPDYGELTFTDEGHIADVRLFGGHQGVVTVGELKDLLELGPRLASIATSEGPTTLVLDDLVDPVALLTGPIVLPETGIVATVVVETTKDLAVVGPLQEPSAAVLAPLPTRWSRIVSVRIPSTPSLSLGTLQAKTLAEYRAETLEEVPTAVSLWRRFVLGMAFTLQIVWLVFSGVSNQGIPLLLGATSLLVFLLGLVIVARAIRAQDSRLDRLREVGL